MIVVISLILLFLLATADATFSVICTPRANCLLHDYDTLNKSLTEERIVRGLLTDMALPDIE